MKKRIFISAILAGLGLSLFSVNLKDNSLLFSGIESYGKAYDCEVTEPNKVAPKCKPAYTPVDQYFTSNQYVSMNHVGDIKTVWDTYKGEGLTVAVIDSGIDYNHPDFYDENGNSRIRTADARWYLHVQGTSPNYTTPEIAYTNLLKYFPVDSSTRYLDGVAYTGEGILRHTFTGKYNSHGTNAAGTVAAFNHDTSGVGTIGIAPRAKILPIKVDFYMDSVGEALRYIYGLNTDSDPNNDVHVVNMSIEADTTYSTVTTYASSLRSIGTIVVAAAGNSNTDTPSYPAANPNIIGVGALDKDSSTDKASYSNYNASNSTPSTTNNNVEVVAPGTVYVPNYTSGGSHSYTETYGTSFASPIVAGAALLWREANPSGTVNQFLTALHNTCIDIGDPGWDTRFGYGKIDISKLVINSSGPTGITVNNPEIKDDFLTLEVGDTFDFNVTVNGIGSFNHSVEYDWLDHSGINIDSSGHLTALAVSDDFITISSTVDPIVSAMIGIEVMAKGTAPKVNSVTVSPSVLNLDLNGSASSALTATVDAINGADNTVTWSSSNTSIATVSSGGLVTAKATGSTTITATSNFDGSKTSTCAVTVTDSTVHVTGVSLNKDTTSISKGSSETLTATVSPNNATNKNVTWESSNTSVATVSNGVVSVPSNATVGATATITVKTVDGNYTDTCTITVAAEITPETLTITRSSFTNSGGYNWYTWSQNTSSNKSVSGKAELYTTATGFMQFNKSKGNSVAALFNTTAIPGSITKIEATTDSTGTARSWNAYVTSTACSGSGSTLTFGSNKTAVGSSTTIGKSSTSFGTSTAGYSYFCIQENENSASFLSEVKITYTPKAISSIAVKTAPTKTVYDAGDSFDPTGLVITATYSDNTTEDISYTSQSASSFAFNPGLNDALTTSNTSITITYGTKTCSQPITVNEVATLSSITISGYKTAYVEGDTFSFGGTVIAHFSDSTSSNVTSSATFTGYNTANVGNQTVTVHYTYKSIEKTATYGITVSAGTLSSIDVSGQTTVYEKGATFSFDGTCTVTFANGYQKVVTPTSVSSPDMTTGGNKTVTVSYSYNNKTVSTTYDISVNAYRTVIEAVYSTLGTITYPNNTETISVVTLSITEKTRTIIENNTIRVGNSDNGGYFYVKSTTSNIYKVVISAKAYGSDTDVIVKIGNESNTMTSTYTEYTREYANPTNSVKIETTTKKKRANIQTITVYTKTEQDIGQSDDCVGLETFINTYMHMDYTENKGWCNDNEHHYYSTAKTAFNGLNDHQRSLFVGNSAYSVEWARLSTWASKNGDSLGTDNRLSRGSNIISPITSSGIDNLTILIISIGLVSLGTCIGLYFFYLKKKENN